jgi:hypothetical protein
VLRHAPRGHVVRVDDGDEAAHAEGVASVVANRGRGLGGKTMTLGCRKDVVSELDLLAALDRITTTTSIGSRRGGPVDHVSVRR